MYSFRQRNDTRVVDEPLYGHYLRATGVAHPAAAELMVQLESDAGRAVEAMVRSDARPVVFFKNMAHHLRGLQAGHMEALFSGALTHALLIRDPHEMLPSLARVLQEPSLDDTGLVEQCWILERELRAGRSPLVLNSRDLLLDPPTLLAQVCDRLGLPFDERMLTWPAGPKPEDGPWAPHWYSSVHASVGFAPYRPPREPVPAELRGLLAECLPYFATLEEHSLAAGGGGVARD